MALEDVLKSYVPVENEDGGGFEILKGTYKCAITKLARVITEKDGQMFDRYELELTVNQVLDGNGGTGRKFWRKYDRNSDEAVKRMINDLFTIGLTLPTSSVEQFENNFFVALDRDAMVRAWGWTPDVRKDGTVIPKEEQVAVQMFKVVSAKKVKTNVKLPSIPF